MPTKEQQPETKTGNRAQRRNRKARRANERAPRRERNEATHTKRARMRQGGASRYRGGGGHGRR